MVCYGCFAFFLLLGGLLVTLVGYYPLDMDHILSDGCRTRPHGGSGLKIVDHGSMPRRLFAMDRAGGVLQQKPSK